MRPVTATRQFRAKAVATACGALLSMALAGPSAAFTSTLPPQLNVNSQNVFVGQTSAGTYTTITGVDVWDTFGYALAVSNGAGGFTDYIVQKVAVFNPGSVAPSGFSIGILMVVDGTFTGTDGTKLLYNFDAIRSFGVYLQNLDGGTVTTSFDINTMGNLATGFNVLGGGAMRNLIDPATCTECAPPSVMNGGYGSTLPDNYTGVFNLSNELSAGTAFMVSSDGIGGTKPFLQANNSSLPTEPDPTAGQSIFDYLAGLSGGARTLVQMSRGAQGEPGVDVAALDGDDTSISAADQLAAANKFYTLFNGLGLWVGPLTPEDEGWESVVFTTAADPATDFAAAVPEPQTLILLGTALIGLAGIRRRRIGA